ncbi:type II toxin-antitoxin system HicA family toxin [Selenomonas sp. oral taxon 478]|uniref:type II toxin-antitoxin system HicA family toxin n=1 Tax=Selenomonas sp. oral taxon 478 TaxID=712538 RepID=UPI0008FFA448|nr:type II toxin-antitoxin system HicA family toxin [Selenomonas sp. oral taxon 478]
MEHYNKLLQAVENNPADVSFDDLEKLMTKVGGFTCRKGKGDHYTFSHPKLQEILTVDSRGKRRPLKAIYVKRALVLFRRAVE